MAEIQLATLAAEAREAIDSQDLARAADSCRRALVRFPRWVEGYWLLGHILVESGYVAQARSCFEAVASAMPDDPRAYQGLADVAEQQHDLATAVAGLVRALEVGETSPSVLEELRRLQQQAGYVVDNPFTTARVAHARLIAGQYEEADVAADRALQQEPERLDLLVVQAVARLFGGDRRGSEAICQRLLDLSPDCLKALAILRYLRPGQDAASMADDLDALDPEGRTLVWLRGQMTTLGYEADDLPLTPNLVRWQEERTVQAEPGRELRPLDRLIPELEEVWPQWLLQVAQDTPEAQSDEQVTQPPPPSDVATEHAPAAPSFLGDVDSLAREFEDAMRPAAPEKLPPLVSAEAEDAVTEPVVTADAAKASSFDWPPPPPPDAEGEQTEVAAATTLDAAPAESEPVPADADADGEFGQWRNPEPASAMEASAAVGTVSTAASELEPVLAGQSDDGWAPSEKSEAGEESVSEELVAEGGVPVQLEQDQGTEAVPVSTEPAMVAQALPPTVAEDDLASLRRGAAAAAVAGEYWSAIDRYGTILAKLRAASVDGE